MKTPFFKPALLIALCLSGWTTAQAQTPGAIEQSEALRRRQDMEKRFKDATATGGSAPELFAEETKDVGPQSILKMKQKKTYFEVVADSQFFYTSNMLLAEKNPGVRLTDTSVFVNTAQFALAPTPYQIGPGLLAPRIGYRHQWFDYGLEKNSRGLGSFDFDVSTVFVDLRYRLGENWSVEAGFDWMRLLNHTPTYFSYDEIYKEYAPRVGVFRQFSFSETKVLSVGYQGSFHFSETPGNIPENQNNRLDNSLIAAYTHALTSQLVLQPYYRIQYTHYTASPFGTRNDLLQTIGLSIHYYPTTRSGVRLFAGYDLKESDQPIVADYRKLDAGRGLNFNLKV